MPRTDPRDEPDILGSRPQTSKYLPLVCAFFLSAAESFFTRSEALVLSGLTDIPPGSAGLGCDPGVEIMMIEEVDLARTGSVQGVAFKGLGVYQRIEFDRPGTCAGGRRMSDSARFAMVPHGLKALTTTTPSRVL